MILRAAGEVPVRPLDHLDARTGVAGNVEDRDTRRESVRDERVPERVGAAALRARQRRAPDTTRAPASCASRGSRHPRQGTEPGTEPLAGTDTIASSARDVSGTRRRARDVFPYRRASPSENTPLDYDDGLGPPHVSPLERDPLLGPEPRLGRDDHERRPRADLPRIASTSAGENGVTSRAFGCVRPRQLRRVRGDQPPPNRRIERLAQRRQRRVAHPPSVADFHSAISAGRRSRRRATSAPRTPRSRTRAARATSAR